MRRSRAFVIRRKDYHSSWVYANHIVDSKSVSRLTSTPATASAATYSLVVGTIFHAENKHRLTLAHNTRAPIKREWEPIHLPEVTAYGFVHFAKINKLNVSCGWSKFYGWARLGMPHGKWHGLAERTNRTCWLAAEKKVHWRHCVWCARVRSHGWKKKIWLCIGHTTVRRSLLCIPFKDTVAAPTQTCWRFYCVRNKIRKKNRLKIGS